MLAKKAVYTKNSQPLWEKQAKYIPFIKNRAWQVGRWFVWCFCMCVFNTWQVGGSLCVCGAKCLFNTTALRPCVCCTRPRQGPVFSFYKTNQCPSHTAHGEAREHVVVEHVGRSYACFEVIVFYSGHRVSPQTEDRGF